MALQKWAAPAGSPLLSTKTETGPSGTFGARYNQTFGADADIAVGATLKIFAAGTITTTGAPTVQWFVSGLNGGPGSQTFTADANVTGQKWTLEATIIYRGVNAGSAEFAYDIRLTGLSASPVHELGTNTTLSTVAYFEVAVNWDDVANDADSGDIITMDLCDALWIG